MLPITHEWVDKAEGAWGSAGRDYRARKAPNFDGVFYHTGVWVILVMLGMGGICRANGLPAPRAVTLPSAAPSGSPAVDRIAVVYYPAAPAAHLLPAVVALPPSGGSARDPIMRRLAQRLAAKGISCAVMDLPYHGFRRRPGVSPAAPYLEGSVPSSVQALGQAASDVRTVASWLATQHGVDPRRLGVVGISLGAIVAHLAMGEDARLGAGVAVLGGGDLPDLSRTSVLVRLLRQLYSQPLDPATLGGLGIVDPLTYAGRNHPRRVLMIEAARDLLVPPRDSTALWEALGRPPIQWLDVNHFALGLTPESAFRAASAYLWSVWNGQPITSGDALPQAGAPTLKVGLLAQWGRPVTPALQWQFYTFAWRHDHLSLIHADLGLTGRGPFLGLGATVTPFVDLGVSPRFDRHGVRPYLAFHVVL